MEPGLRIRIDAILLALVVLLAVQVGAAIESSNGAGLALGSLAFVLGSVVLLARANARAGDSEPV